MRFDRRAGICLAAAILVMCSTAPGLAAEPQAAGNAIGIAPIFDKATRPIAAKAAAPGWLPRRFARCAHLGCPGYFIVGIAY